MNINEFKTAVNSVSFKIDEIIETTTPLVNNSPTEFIRNHVKVLGGLIKAYSNFFTQVNVTCRTDAESLWTEMLIKHQEVEPCVDQLLDCEVKFDKFLDGIDEKLKEVKMVSGNIYQQAIEGEVMSKDIMVNNIDGSEVNISLFIPSIGSLILIMLRHFS